MNRPAAIEAINIDPEQATKAIFAEVDVDGSGHLSSAELAKLPPIAEKRSWYDGDGDGQISPRELQAGLTAIFDPKVRLVSVSCEVLRNNQPLPSAKVEFVPLTGLEEAIPVASGVTDTQGVAKLAVAPDDLPANSPTTVPSMRPGLYLVKVTHADISVPRKYNAETELGKEVSKHTTAGGPLKVNLKF
jgi:hypothetical protein